MTPLAKKLLIKPGARILVLNAPEGYGAQLEPLPEGAEVSIRPEGAFDVVQLFARNKAELEAHAPAALAALGPKGILWISYPKGSSKKQTDLTRDAGWDILAAAGLDIVAQVSIDDTWSAGRFKAAETVKRSGRSGEA